MCLISSESAWFKFYTLDPVAARSLFVFVSDSKIGVDSTTSSVDTLCSLSHTVKAEHTIESHTRTYGQATQLTTEPQSDRETRLATTLAKKPETFSFFSIMPNTRGKAAKCRKKNQKFKLRFNAGFRGV